MVDHADDISSLFLGVTQSLLLLSFRAALFTDATHHTLYSFRYRKTVLFVTSLLHAVDVCGSGVGIMYVSDKIFILPLLRTSRSKTSKTSIMLTGLEQVENAE